MENNGRKVGYDDEPAVKLPVPMPHQGPTNFATTGKQPWCNDYSISKCPGGEIGRRKGLKILFLATGVWVQVPPRALYFKLEFNTATHRNVTGR